MRGLVDGNCMFCSSVQLTMMLQVKSTACESERKMVDSSLSTISAPKICIATLSYLASGVCRA